jgi:hypothetical protein
VRYGFPGLPRRVVVHYDDGIIEKAVGILVLETPQQAFEHLIAAERADADGDVVFHEGEYDIIDNRTNVKKLDIPRFSGLAYTSAHPT